MRHTLEEIKKTMSIDFTRVLERLIDVSVKQRDKELVHDLIKTHEEQQVQLLRIYVESFEKTNEKVFDFVQHQFDAYSAGSQIRKILSFSRSSSLERECWDAALADAQDMLRLISPFENPGVQEIISQRSQTQNMLCAHFSDMLSQETPMGRIDISKIANVLGVQEEE